MHPLAEEGKEEVGAGGGASHARRQLGRELAVRAGKMYGRKAGTSMHASMAAPVTFLHLPATEESGVARLAEVRQGKKDGSATVSKGEKALGWGEGVRSGRRRGGRSCHE